MFTRKHYRAIAEIIREDVEFIATTDGHCLNCSYRIKGLTVALANYFAQDNPRFDREKFLKACGL